MSRARFQVFTVDRTEVGWRCVASNNRAFARSPKLYVDEDAARAAVGALLQAGPELALSVVLDTQGRWRWLAEHQGEVLAVSSRWYYRRAESETATAKFRAAAGAATVVDQAARFTAAGPDHPLLRTRRTGSGLVPPTRRPLAERRGPPRRMSSRATGGGSHVTT